MSVSKATESIIFLLNKDVGGWSGIRPERIQHIDTGILVDWTPSLWFGRLTYVNYGVDFKNQNIFPKGQDLKALKRAIRQYKKDRAVFDEAERKKRNDEASCPIIQRTFTWAIGKGYMKDD